MHKNDETEDKKGKITCTYGLKIKYNSTRKAIIQQ